MGATVNPVTSGSRTLKDAVNEALRDWVQSVDSTHYLIGSVVGPHPFPMIVRDFQSIIGQEIKTQSIQQFGELPTAVIACVGGGSNAAGSFFQSLMMRWNLLVWKLEGEEMLWEIILLPCQLGTQEFSTGC